MDVGCVGPGTIDFSLFSGELIQDQDIDEESGFGYLKHRSFIHGQIKTRRVERRDP